VRWPATFRTRPACTAPGSRPKAGHGFTTNGGNSTVTMFDLKTLAVLKQIKVEQGGLDGIMYDEPDDKIILTNHSRPIGTLTALDPKTGDIVATVELEDTAPEGAAADGKGHIFFVNNESKHTIQVIDVKTWRRRRRGRWRRARTDRDCVRPGEQSHLLRLQQYLGRARRGQRQGGRDHRERHARRCARLGSGEEADLHPERRRRQRHRRPSGCGGPNTPWSATVPTFAGAKTIAVDTASHNVYLFQPERGPVPRASGRHAAACSRGRTRRRGPQGPIVASWFIVITP